MKKHTGEIIRKYGKYRVINCKNCKFIHINPIPTNEELQNFYENDYYQKTKPNYIIGNEKDIEYQNYTFDEKLDFLEKKFTSKTRRILDIGSGPGFFLRRAKKRGWDVLGIEPSPIACKYSKKEKIPTIQKFFDEVNLKEIGKFELFNKNINSLNQDLDKKILKIRKKKIHAVNSDIIIYNHSRNDWNNIPIEIKLHFKPRFIKNGFDVYYKNKKIKSQLENIKFFKDGYIKSTTLILTPKILKKSKINIKLIKNNIFSLTKKNEKNIAKTSNVKISLSNKGGIINYLSFPNISKKPIIDIKRISKDKKINFNNLLPNQIFISDKNGKKFSDLQETNVILENYPIRKNYDVKLLDCALHEIHPDSKKFTQEIKDFNPDVVGISAWTIHKKMATMTLKKVKEINENIITIAGGPHFTGSADYSLINDQGIIDYVLKGEAEFTFKQFLDTVSKINFSDNDLKKIDGLCFIKSDGSVHETPMTFPPNLDDFGQPDYTVIDIHAYLKKGYFYRIHKKMHAPILSTRGCPYTCDYCAAPYLNGRGIRKHSLEYMKELIENLYENFGIRHFNIIDDNFTFDVFYAKAFCKMIIDNKHKFKGISFGTPNGIRIDRTDQQLFYLMKAAGWERLMVAPESGSPKVLDAMLKHLDLSVVPEKIKQIQKAGLEVEAFFIIGHPGEDKNTIEETRQFIKDVRFDMASFYAFQPLPGTPIYDTLVKQGSITKADEMTSYSVVNWVPENWTKEEIHDIIYDFKRMMIDMHPWRFERIFAKHTLMGKFVEKITDQHRRHKLVMRVYKFRKKITDWLFILKHGAELKTQISLVILDEHNLEEKRRRENRLKEYEISIMQKSDKLKEKARITEVTTKIPHLSNSSNMDMALNACNKIRTHKNMFED